MTSLYDGTYQKDPLKLSGNASLLEHLYWTAIATCACCSHIKIGTLDTILVKSPSKQSFTISPVLPLFQRIFFQSQQFSRIRFFLTCLVLLSQKKPKASFPTYSCFFSFASMSNPELTPTKRVRSLSLAGIIWG